jgi:transmembrane sensor
MQTEDKTAPVDQALQWFVLLRSGDAVGADFERFQTWLKAEETHRQEFDKLKRLWKDLDRVKPLLPDELLHTTFASSISIHHQSIPKSRKRWTAAWLSPVMAASLLLVLAGIWSVNVPNVVEYRTALGEQRTIQLSDGSILTLNTDTSVRTELSLLRRVVILEKGEAFFVVAHEKHRSFDVTAGTATIRDIGTRFLVRRQAEAVTVTVVDGAVEVRARPAISKSEVRQVLKAGEQLSYGQIDGLSPVMLPSLETSMAWLEGKIIFEGRPLVELIHEMHRYQEGDIQILDPAIGELQVSGVFGIHDREGFLNAIERAVPVQVTRANKNLVILEPKQNLVK